MATPEFFVVAISFAAPFVSDTTHKHMNAANAQAFVDAIELDEHGRGRAEWYNHPCGLFAVLIYASADDYHKDKDPLASWQCPKAQRG